MREAIGIGVFVAFFVGLILWNTIHQYNREESHRNIAERYLLNDGYKNVNVRYDGYNEFCRDERAVRFTASRENILTGVQELRKGYVCIENEKVFDVVEMKLQ